MDDLRIFYPDRVVVGPFTEETWLRAPSSGVQYIVLMRPYPDKRRPWRNVDDRQIWTGEDVYDPFGWGAKTGSLISDIEYHGMWKMVAYA